MENNEKIRQILRESSGNERLVEKKYLSAQDLRVLKEILEKRSGDKVYLHELISDSHILLPKCEKQEPVSSITHELDRSSLFFFLIILVP